MSLEIQESPGTKPCRRAIFLRFTLVELLVVVAVVSLLASLLLPALSGARASALSLDCKSHLRQIGQGFACYANDNGDVFPRGAWTGGIDKIWCTDGGPLSPYVPYWVYYGCDEANGWGAKQSFACPAAAEMWEYAINYFVGYLNAPLKVCKILSPSQTFLVTDHVSWYVAPISDEGSAVRRWRHPGPSVNTLYCDGHVDRQLRSSNCWNYSTPLWINKGDSW